MANMNNLYSNEPENNHLKIASSSNRKSLGQFFTPFQVAYFMSEWLIDTKKRKISLLDPAAGLGVFSRAIEKAIQDKNINLKVEHHLKEIDNFISSKLSTILSPLNGKVFVYNEDFLKISWDKHYDAIIANPPYYKHHFIENKEKICSEISKQAKHNFSIQNNIYCWFLIKSLELLKEGGKLVFIIPTEFLNSNYGAQIKDYLKNSGIVLHLINVNFTETVFNDALTTSIIILAHKKKNKFNKINFYTVNKTEELKDLNFFLKTQPHKTYKTSILDPKAKWRNYFNGNHNKIKKENLLSFSTFGNFSRGIATGANTYFTLSSVEVEKFNIPNECLIPCITKANQVKGLTFNQENFNQLNKSGKKVYLFDGEKYQDNQNCKKYIKLGEDQNIHKRFLTRNRDPWYALEKREKSFLWACVFGRSGLKFIWNNSNCRNLTCFHAFYPTVFGKKYLHILFIYLYTKLSKQLIDLEKREFGAGLGKYEPNDINRSYILNFDKLNDKQINRLTILQKNFINNSQNSTFIDEAETIFRNIY